MVTTAIVCQNGGQGSRVSSSPPQTISCVCGRYFMASSSHDPFVWSIYKQSEFNPLEPAWLVSRLPVSRGYVTVLLPSAVV